MGSISSLILGKVAERGFRLTVLERLFSDII